MTIEAGDTDGCDSAVRCAVQVCTEFSKDANHIRMPVLASEVSRRFSAAVRSVQVRAELGQDAKRLKQSSPAGDGHQCISRLQLEVNVGTTRMNLSDCFHLKREGRCCKLLPQNTSLNFGHYVLGCTERRTPMFIMKNPVLRILRFLTEKLQFQGVFH